MTVFCSPLKWSWLKYCPSWALLGFDEQPMWQKIWMPSRWGDSLFGFCQHLLERTWVFSLRLSLEPHFPTLKSPTCFLFFFFSSGKCFIIIFVSCWNWPSLSLMTFGFILQPFSSLFFMVPCCCEQNSFFKRQMVATLFSLNKKAKQLLRCKQSCGQQIVCASSVGEVSL